MIVQQSPQTSSHPHRGELDGGGAVVEIALCRGTNRCVSDWFIRHASHNHGHASHNYGHQGPTVDTRGAPGFGSYVVLLAG